MITIEYIQRFCSYAEIKEKINEQSSFEELGIDSLTIIELLNQIEIDFNIVVPWTQFDSKQTVGDFIKTINKLFPDNAF